MKFQKLGQSSFCKLNKLVNWSMVGIALNNSESSFCTKSFIKFEQKCGPRFKHFTATSTLV
jgi:hypothetical protein